MASSRAEIAPLGGWIRIVHWVVRNALRAGFRYRRRQRERMPLTGPVLIVANHGSYLDPLLVGAISNRPLRYLARSTLFRGAFGELIRRMGAVPVERDGVGVGGSRTILAALAHGDPVLVFPEGTRSPDGRLGRLRPGVVRIAQRSGAPLLPVWIEGSARAWPKGARVPRPRAVTVRVGEPYRIGATADPRQEIDALRSRLLALSGATAENDENESREGGPPRGGA